jgi:hypothetical protein
MLAINKTEFENYDNIIPFMSKHIEGGFEYESAFKK